MEIGTRNNSDAVRKLLLPVRKLLLPVRKLLHPVIQQKVVHYQMIQKYVIIFKND
jgi:hypothetical protein